MEFDDLSHHQINLVIDVYRFLGSRLLESA